MWGTDHFKDASGVLEVVVDNVSSVVYVRDADGRVVMANRSFEDIFGVTAADLSGGNLFTPSPNLPAPFLENDLRVIESGRAGEFEESVMCDDGVHHYVSYRFPLRDADGAVRAVCCVASDDTALKRSEDAASRLHEKLLTQFEQMQGANIILHSVIAEEERMEAKAREIQAQLIQAEKMASLGQLAAGVAHEINNPLGYLSGNLSTLTTYVETFRDVLGKYAAFTRAAAATHRGLAKAVNELREFEEEKKLSYILDDVTSLLEETQEGADRVKDIVQRLKVFAHMDKCDAEDIDVNESLETALKLVWNELKYKCKVRKELNGTAPVLGYPGQLCQVFMNLLLNAAQAIPDNGDIVVVSRDVDGGVQIEVTDTGRGIKEEHLSKIFAPFFTTKPAGQGTGLGMSISRDIILKHGGEITVRSKEGEGTTFTIVLPARARKSLGAGVPSQERQIS